MERRKGEVTGNKRRKERGKEKERKGKGKGKERKSRWAEGGSRGEGRMSKSSCLVNGIGTHANGFVGLAWTNATPPH